MMGNIWGGRSEIHPGTSVILVLFFRLRTFPSFDVRSNIAGMRMKNEHGQSKSADNRSPGSCEFRWFETRNVTDLPGEQQRVDGWRWSKTPSAHV
jgi:hypothetical protein